MLPWATYNFEVSADTDNEQSAVAYYGEYLPDLFILDLELKTGNGLSLIKTLRALDKDLKILVISERDDYESVRGAFISGADDYVIKLNLKYTDIERVVLNILENDKSDKGNDWHDTLESMLGLVRDHQEVDENAIINLIKENDLDVLKNEYKMIFFRMDNIRNVNLGFRNYETLENLRGDTNEEFAKRYREKLKFREKIQKMASEIYTRVFADIEDSRIIFTKKHSGLIVVPNIDDEILLNKTRTFKQMLQETCFYSYSFTISRTYYGYDDFLIGYRELMERHQWKFYDGDGCIIEANLPRKFSNLDRYDESIALAIYNDLLTNDIDDLNQILNRLYAKVEHDKVMVSDVYGFLVWIFDYIENKLKNIEIDCVQRFQYYRYGIIEAENLEILKSEMDRIVISLVSFLRSLNVNKYSKKVNEILAYVDNNIKYKISLSMVANYIGFSEVHTSRIFKNEVGIGINQYINDIKMEKARELLENTNMKIKDVAFSVGYNDQLYFNKQFHKKYNFGPKEFRKKCNKNKIKF